MPGPAPDKQLHQPSPAGTHHQPNPDTHEPDQPGSVPCICAARPPALRGSRCGVARTSRWQSSALRREPCPERPRNNAHCLEARQNPARTSYVAWLPIVVLYCSFCVPPSLYSDKKATVTKKLGESKPHSRTDPELIPRSRDEYLYCPPPASRAIKWSNYTPHHCELRSGSSRSVGLLIVTLPAALIDQCRKLQSRSGDTAFASGLPTKPSAEIGMCLLTAGPAATRSLSAPPAKPRAPTSNNSLNS